MNPHARYHPRSAEIEIHTHHATHTHTRTHKSCPRLPRRRPPPTPLARRAAQRRSCLSLWGGRRCAAPPSYTRDSTVLKGPGGGPGCAGRPRGARVARVGLVAENFMSLLFMSVWVRSLPRDANLDGCAEKSRCRPNRRTQAVIHQYKEALCPALVNATREV